MQAAAAFSDHADAARAAPAPHAAHVADAPGTNAEAASAAPATHAVHMLSFYKEKYNLISEDFPNGYAADQCSISLPLFHGIKEEEQDYVIKKVLEFKK